MSQLLTLFDLGEPVYAPTEDGGKSKAPTHAAYMRVRYGLAPAGCLCGGCKHFSQEKRTTKIRKNMWVSTQGSVEYIPVDVGGCQHYTGGRVKSWTPGQEGCRLWEGKGEE
jgi:hypothetical protein